MLKKENRITKKKEFDFIFKNGKSFFVKTLGVKIAKNNYSANRFGVIVGKKISKKSVKRNKIKRLVRENIREYILNMVRGYDIIVIALPSIKDSNFIDIKKTLQYCFKKTKLL